jgi:hypothetical protein
MSAHTPGPWHSYSIGTAYYIATATGYTIARTDASYAYKSAHAANAALAAAAPDMLVALEEVSQCLNARQDPDEQEDWLIKCVDSAIAKAKEAPL